MSPEKKQREQTQSGFMSVIMDLTDDSSEQNHTRIPMTSTVGGFGFSPNLITASAWLNIDIFLRRCPPGTVEKLSNERLEEEKAFIIGLQLFISSYCLPRYQNNYLYLTVI